MTEGKLRAVTRFLAVHFPGRQVHQHYDFDRSAQSFKVLLDRDTLLLKVTETFFDDHGEDEVAAALDRMGAGETLARTRGTEVGLIATNAGLQEFRRG